jgi:hypothetical protein
LSGCKKEFSKVLTLSEHEKGRIVYPHCKSKDEEQRWGSLLCRNFKEELDERALTRCCFKGM